MTTKVASILQKKNWKDLSRILKLFADRIYFEIKYYLECTETTKGMEVPKADMEVPKADMETKAAMVDLLPITVEEIQTTIITGIMEEVVMDTDSPNKKIAVVCRPAAQRVEP